MAEVLLPKAAEADDFRVSELLSDFSVTRLIGGSEVSIPLTKQEMYEAFTFTAQNENM